MKSQQNVFTNEFLVICIFDSKKHFMILFKSFPFQMLTARRSAKCTGIETKYYEPPLLDCLQVIGIKWN